VVVVVVDDIFDVLYRLMFGNVGCEYVDVVSGDLVV
jgi:hypothetical protein